MTFENNFIEIYLFIYLYRTFLFFYCYRLFNVCCPLCNRSNASVLIYTYTYIYIFCIRLRVELSTNFDKNVNLSQTFSFLLLPFRSVNEQLGNKRLNAVSTETRERNGRRRLDRKSGSGGRTVTG